MLKSGNLVHRLFARQIARGSANNQGLRNRQLYENIVPSHTVYDVDCPDHVFRKFTNDGQYLVCFSRNLQDLVVYRHNWLTHCSKGADCDASDDLPPKSKKFESYFTQLYVVSLASGNEVICKDFFLTTENNLYGIFATTTGLDYSAPASRGAVPGVPSVERICIHLVRLSDGVVVNERVFHDDYIQLSHNVGVGGMGVFLYDDLLVVLSIRFQCIYILQVREAGLLVDVRSIGAHCREDDELKIHMQVQEEAWFQQQQAAVRKARGVQTETDDAQAHGEQQPKEGLPFCWNVNSSLKSRNRQNGRIHQRGQPSVSRACLSPGGSHSVQEGAAEATPATPAGMYGGLQGADLDLQYDGYFSGLFTSLDNGHRHHYRAAAGAGAGASVVRTRDPSPSQGSHSRQGNGFEAGPSQDSRAASMRLNRAFSTYDNVYDNQQRAHHNALASTSGSVSGGQHLGMGPLSWQNRSVSSASGESTDLLTSERTSQSYRASSTTLTSTTCSGSGSGSGSSKRDWSVTGGSASYGEAGGGLASRNTAENNHEYVVSSRTHRPRASGLTDMMEVDEVGASIASAHLANGAAVRTAVATAPPMLSGSRFVADGGGLVRSLDMQNGSVSAPVHESITSAGPRVSLAPEGSRRAPISAHRSNAVLRSSGHMLRGGVPSNPSSSNGRPANGLVLGVNGSGVGVQAEHGNNTRISDGVGQGNLMLGGLKQRLLSFIFQGIRNDADPVQRANRLKRFYYVFQQYVDLVMWKVQFLDRYHLLIKFGSVEGVVPRTDDISEQSAFFAVYNLETTEMLGFYQNSSEEFLLSYEQYCDHFRVVPSVPVSMSFITSHSNNLYAREQFHKQKAALINSKIAMAKVVRKTLAPLPFTSQSHSPSPYFDQALFHFDEKLISAVDRYRPCMEHPVKFISRRRPNSLKFKVNPGLELGSNDSRGKRASFIFHPIYPFAISVQQAHLQPSIVNFHFRN